MPVRSHGQTQTTVNLPLPGRRSTNQGYRTCKQGTRALNVTSGLSHTCVLLDSGSRCFGSVNADGQLGRDDLNPALDASMAADIDYAMPGEIARDAIAVSAGDYFNCAILSPDRAVKCWGQGGKQQLGTDSSANLLSPSRIAALPLAAQSISSGAEHVCIVEYPGRKLRCWGANAEGQCGVGTTDPSVAWQDGNVQIDSEDTEITKVSAGYQHTCALKASRQIRCFGDNFDGQLGTGLT